jgi:phosphorylcholine metabolism protein LicD
MNAAGVPIAKRIGMKFLYPSYLVFRFFVRIRYFGRHIPRHQVFSFLILRRYLSLCKNHNIDTWAFDGTLLGAIRDGKFAGRPGDLDFIVSEEDAERLQSLITEHLFAKTSYIRWFPLFKQTFKVELTSYQSGSRFYRKVFVLGRLLQMLEISSAKIVSHENRKFLVFDSSVEGKDYHCFDASDFYDYCDAKIYGLQVRTPSHPTKYLENLYGADWMTPRITKTDVLERKPHLWANK